MRNQVLFLVLILSALGLDACSASRPGAGVSASKFSLMTGEETLATARKLVASGEISPPRSNSQFTLPEDALQLSNLRGAAVNGSDHIIYLAASEGAVTGRMLPPRPGAITGPDPEFPFFNGILYSSVDMELLGSKVLRLNENNQWQPSDAKVPKGEYRWHIGSSGLFLGQTTGGFFIEFQTPLQGKPEHRYEVDFLVDEQKPEQLSISVANQQIHITGKASGPPTSTPQRIEAPSAIVEGTAFSKKLGTPLKGISVKLVHHAGVSFQEKQRTITDDSGHFRFENVSAGQYVLGGPSLKNELDYLEFENSEASKAELSVGNRGTFSFGTVYLPDKRQ